MTETLRSGRPNPCNGCPDRYYACSDTCIKPAFVKWKVEQDLIRENRKKYNCPIWTQGDRDQRRK